jgi:putative flippase GtrA
VPIATVYVEGNASSHFRPLADSVRVYAPILTFCASSLTAFAVDAAGVLYLHAVTGSLLVAVVGARAVSATVNYLVNRRLVFREGRDRTARSSALRYAALLVVMLVANWAVLSVLTVAGLALLPAKIVTDLSLFLASYAAQHRLVFASRRPVDRGLRRKSYV